MFDNEYATAGHARHLCFGWGDGKRMFLNYAYLISGEYNPQEASIQLIFTTHSVHLKGAHLESLFYELMAQISRQIVCEESRYELISEDDSPSVYDIVIAEIDA